MIFAKINEFLKYFAIGKLYHRSKNLIEVVNQCNWKLIIFKNYFVIDCLPRRSIRLELLSLHRNPHFRFVLSRVSNWLILMLISFQFQSIACFKNMVKLQNKSNFNGFFQKLSFFFLQKKCSPKLEC